MPVHVNEVTTEIVPEPDGEGTGDRDAAGEPPTWELVDRVRRARARIESEEARTRAEGFVD